MQDRSMVCTKRTIGSEFVWTHPMLILGDKDQVEARFGSFGDCANPDARSVHCLGRTYHRLISPFGRTRWNSYEMWVMWILVSIYLEIVLVSVQDRYTVCAKHTTSLEIVLDAPNGTPR